MTDKKTEVQTVKKRVPPKAYKPGQSGNPNGRPKKGETWKDVIGKIMRQKVDNKTKKRLIAEKQVTLALAGDKNAVAFLANREEGMPKQFIEHEGAVPVEFTGDNPAEYIKGRIDE